MAAENGSYEEFPIEKVILNSPYDVEVSSCDLTLTFLEGGVVMTSDDVEGTYDFDGCDENQIHIEIYDAEYSYKHFDAKLDYNEAKDYFSCNVNNDNSEDYFG